MGNLTITTDTQQTLVNMYKEPQRFYHGVGHVQHLFKKFSEFLLAMGPEGGTHFATTERRQVKYHGRMDQYQHREIVLMVWFHDCIFSTDEANFRQNEDRSAEFFLYTYNLKKNKLIGMAKNVYDGILASKNHLVTQAGLTLTQQIFLDLDLCGMGEDYDTFIVNGNNIRTEFSWLEEHLFTENRMKFFQTLMLREHIYYHPKMRELFEQPTRDNINRWLQEHGSNA